MTNSRRLYQKQYRLANRERINKQKREYRLANPGSRKTECRVQWLKRNYQMSVEKYEEMLQDQNGCCAICGKHHLEINKAFNVDHNHENGRVRGLLCTGCNTALGLLNDNVMLFDKAKEYVLKYK